MADNYYLEQRTLDDLRKLKAEVALLKSRQTTPPVVRPQRYDHFKNVASETMPAYSVFWSDDSEDLGEKRCVNANKPTADTFSRNLFISGGDEVKQDQWGALQHGPLYLLSYDTGTPESGETWGPKPDQWTASKNYPGFRCLGIYDGERKLMLATLEFQPFYLCKADSAISKGSTGTASLYVGASGSESDSTVNVESCRAKWGAIATSKWCGVSFVNGVPYITQLEC